MVPNLGFLAVLLIFANGHEETVSRIDETQFSVAKHEKYLIYDVNFGEGFNLRRDVYMRVANAVRLLREEGHNYILVLPPWGRLHHWNRVQYGLRWSEFFDTKSLNQFVPVIEFEEYLEKRKNSPEIEQVLYLQHYKEGWGEEFVKKFDERECISELERFYRKDGRGLWKGWFFGFEEVRAQDVKCVSIQGDSETLKKLLGSMDLETVFIDRAETILHEHYGEVDYWKARRSMRYSRKIVDAGNEFRRKYLDSTDEQDLTVMQESWEDQKNLKRTAKGGPYLGIHWRRRDFLVARESELPSIEGAARIIAKNCKNLGVKKVYLATDASDKEVEKLKWYLTEGVEVYRFLDERFNDGQIAIIDQWICAHSRHFIGSHESTFSFRIQEDREILGFPIEATFNRMCPDEKPKCEQPTKWKIVY